MDQVRKKSIDTFGAASLIGFSLLLGINHIVIKLVNIGIQPIFFCGLRSLLAVFFIISWMRYKRIPIEFFSAHWKMGVLAGLVFAAEFLCLFIALDYTTVVRNSIIYYSMPLWLSLMAHFLLPTETLSRTKILGLGFAFSGVVWAILSKSNQKEEYTLIGDFFALGGALGWAAIILLARATDFSKIKPEMQLLWMVSVSTPILLIASLFFGDLVREFQLIHLLGLLFQSLFVVTIGFIFWLWLLSIYPASGVASFAFLTPLFGILFGWWFLDEDINSNIIIAACLVVSGIYVINKSSD